MSMEKVIKSVNALKIAYGEIAAVEEKNIKDGSLNPKERQSHCNTIVECMSSSSLRNNADFNALLGISFEILLLSCSDENADVRLNSEECMNRLIKVLYETSIHRILVELFKEIKKNGATRSLKAALVRFSDLCFNIRPLKCRPYMLNLLPCLVHASQREEESIQEALGPAVLKIFSNLGSFANEGEVQGLIASFLKNLSHDSVTVRRTAGSCLHSIVSTSRRVSVTLLPLLDSILDILTQRRDNRSTILGCLPSLRAITPLLAVISDDNLNKILAKVLMFSVYYSCHSDHTVVTSALELLEQLLKNFPHGFKSILTKQVLQSCYDMEEKVEVSSDNAAGGNGSLTSSENSASIVTVKESEPEILSWKDLCSSPSSNHSNLNHSTLIRLSRLLCQRFLLKQGESQLISDSEVRVSTKTLALESMIHLIRLHPLVFKLRLTEHKSGTTVISDVLLYLKHTDPKLRGAALVLVATFVKSELTESSASINKSDEVENTNYDETIAKFPRLNDLIDMIVKSYSDDVSTCLRQSCAATSICVDSLLRSKDFHLGLNLLRSALTLSSNSYWLVKVDLLVLLGSLNYRQIAFLESYRKQRDVNPEPTFQSAALAAMLSCLSEDDGRVRKAAAEALVSSVEGFSMRNHVENDHLSLEAFGLCRKQLGKELLGNADDVTHHMNDLVADKSLLKIYRGFEYLRTPKQLEDCVSLLSGEITQLLSHSTSKSLTQGCLLTLKLLSFKYPPGSLPLSWGCYFSTSETYSKPRSGSNVSNSSAKEDGIKSLESSQNLGPLPIVMGLLQSAWLPLDLPAHCDAIILAGNLLAGATNYGLRFQKENITTQYGGGTEDPVKPSVGNTSLGWSGVSNHMISKYARDLFLHLVKLLSISHHVIADVSPQGSSKSVLPTISSNTSLPSPIKKKDKKDGGGGESAKSSPPSGRKLLPSASLSKPGLNKEETDKEKPSKKSLGSFHHNRVLMKLYDLLLGAYANYKGNLEFGENDRFCLFAASALDVLCQLLEIASSQDIANTTEELLGYLKSLFSIQPSLTVQCVQQMLKALFGTNLLSQFELSDRQRTKSSKTSAHLGAPHRYKPTISHQVFHLPLNNLTISLANSSFHHSLSSSATSGETGWFGSVKKRVEEKLNQSSKQSKGNKMSNYIRLFESLVIKSLKMYTYSSSVDFQRHVLNMLAQLVQLRVNYNMLDSDQVFMGFIIKQFESIETGMIRNSDSLVPHVFFFLVLLTYEKHHSKSVIGMSKVIQLCDGLMASGRGVDSHVIPALDPIVHDLFVVRAASKHGQEETTQREVLLQMIVRLLHHPQVYQMTTTVLRFYRNGDVDRWKQVSRQFFDVILPIVANLQVHFSGPDDVSSLFSLFGSLSPTALRPIIALLLHLFSPTPQVTMATIHCWLAKILLILRLLVCHVSEAELIEAVDQVKDSVMENFRYVHQSDQLENVKDGAQLTAWFFDHVIGYLSTELASALNSTTTTSTSDDLMFLVKEFIELLILLTYIHRSGTYKKFTTCTRVILQASPSLRHMENFLLIGEFYPVLTLLWCQYLTHVGYINMQEWGAFTGTGSNGAPTFNQQMVRSGSLVLLCDYVCQSVNQSELASWLIAHHFDDIIRLSGEAPVEDFLSTIEQSPAGAEMLSGVSSYCSSHASVKASFMQRIVRFISALPESLPMLQLLLSPHFIFSPVIAVSRASEQVACNATESLLARDSPEVTQMMTWDDINQLLQLFPEKQKRFARLQSLLVRLRNHVLNEPTLSPASTNQLPSIQSIEQPADKTWLKSLLVAACKENKWTPECAKVLSCCEYDDVMEVMNDEQFSTSQLDVCIAFGISESVHSRDQPPCHDDSLSSIMKASREKLMKLMDEILSRASSTPQTSEQKEESATVKIWSDESFGGNLALLCSCLARYLHANSSLLVQYKLPESAYPQCLKTAVLTSQMIGWQLRHGSMPAISVSTSCFEVFQQALQSDDTNASFVTGDDDVLSVIETLHSLVSAYAGELPLHFPYFPEPPSFPVDERFRSCCVMMSQLFDCLRHSNKTLRHHVPTVLVNPIRNVILHLCRTRLMNSYIRIPRLLWKYGWNPSSEDGTKLPDIPADYLQEKEILSDYISIINHIGWVSRTQFEETWASLLGVLVSQTLIDSATGKQTHEDAISISCLAVRGLTSLVLHCSLQPHAGAVATGSFPIYHRHLPIRLPHSKWGRRLVRVRRILHEELMASMAAMHHCDTHYKYQRSPHDGDIHQQLVRNTERVFDTPSRYGLGQVSARSFYELHGITALRDDALTSDGESVYSGVLSAQNEESDESDVFDAVDKQQGEQRDERGRSLSPLRIRDGVDVHSSVQFLLDLYTEWFRSSESGGATSVPHPLLCECVRSLLLISDLFTEQHQFEWALSTITAFYGSQYSEDDVILQYIVAAMCKTCTVLGMSGNMNEVLLPMLEAAFNSSLASCRVAVLHGALYCLECYPNPHVKDIVDFFVEKVPGLLVSVSGNPSLHNEDMILALISLAYFIIERCQDLITPEFISIILQASSLIFSAAETTSRLYHAVAHGLERLVLVFALSSAETEAVLKVAAEQLNHNPALSRATAACALMVTCMYCGRIRVTFLNRPEDSPGDVVEQEDGVERSLLAMERVSLIFERIRRGRSLDARVMSRILPPILNDFFPPTTILNKVIAEFASNLQPFPDLLAVVLHQVFQSLHNKDQSSLVHEWVILSLSNVIQRTPLSTAIWCLTCLFVSASSNYWINSLLPMVVSRMKQPDATRDWPLFCKAALDFYTHQLQEELDRRSFRSVFLSANEEPYRILLRCLEPDTE